MRYYQIQLDEVRMAPSNLKQFANSKEAKGIMAGFEAEVIFRGKNGENDSDETEPDYDLDERTNGIRSVLDFFEGGGGYNSERELIKLEEELTNDYYEWLAEKSSEYFFANANRIVEDYIEGDDWDWTAAITEALDNEGYSEEDIEASFAAAKAIRYARAQYDDSAIETARMEHKDAFALYLKGKELADDMLEKRVEESIEKQDKQYYEAQENAREAYEEDEGTDDEWMLDAGLTHMTSIANRYQAITWPYWTEGNDDNEGTFTVQAAQRMADSFRSILPAGQKIEVTNWAGKNKSPDTWYFESDGSIEPDDSTDLACEIVSPPMPLKECLEMLDKFFTWLKSEDGYTNETTGFHMGVSMPEQDISKVDFTKLALFLGDKHVLEEFGRLGNTYCKSALGIIENRLSQGEVDPKKVLGYLKEGLNKTASSLLMQSTGFGKFVTINPKDKYIEFRSAGNEDYSENISKLQNTLGRYAQSMYISTHPDMYRKEYEKKLYKLLEPTEKEFRAAKEISRFSAGFLDDTEIAHWYAYLKKNLEKSKTNREAKKGDQLMSWKVMSKRNPYVSLNVLAMNEEEAIEAAQEGDQQFARYAIHTLSADPVRRATEDEVYRYKASKRAKDNKTAKGIQWEVYNKETGKAVYRFNNPENTVQSGIGAALEWYNDLSPEDRPAEARQLGVRPAPETGNTGAKFRYRVRNTRTNSAATTTEAFASPEEAIAWARRRSPDTFPVEDDVQAVPLALPVASPAPQADSNGNWVIRRKDEDGVPYGSVLFRFRAPAINDAAQIALQWSRDNNLRNQVRLSHVDDVPAELLSATPTERYRYKVTNHRTGASVNTEGTHENEAEAVAHVKETMPRQFGDNDTITAQPIFPSRAETPVTRGEWGGSPVVSEPQNFPAANTPATGENFTGRWEIRNRDTGEVLHTLSDIGNSTNVARFGAQRWAERTGYDDEFVVRPVFN
jgi:hypothetical protein